MDWNRVEGNWNLWICRLGLASNWLTTLCVGFSNAGILSIDTRTEQHRSRHQSH
jgi:hypothetical protein